MLVAPPPQVDVDGLPLVYDREAIQSFWDARPGELQARGVARPRRRPHTRQSLNHSRPRQSRWTEFLGLNAPLLTKLVGLLLSGGPGAVAARAGELAGDARRIMEKLGPTYVKIGQLLSARPDIIGQEATTELSKLQDSVARFDSPTALAVIEAELGRPLFEVFAELGDEPVAAASLAQVYRGRLVSGEEVAVKVQRPGIRGVVSKDLYVLRRAAEVYQSIMDRLTPSQNTDYVALMSEFAIGLYTELDFSNEASNAITMRKLLADAAVPGVYVPRVFEQLGSRRLLVMEWVSGRKLSSCSPGEIRALTPVAQEAFLMQLLTWGFVHADPHPGNLLALDDTSGGYSLALLDFGLMARLTLQDREALVSSVVQCVVTRQGGAVCGLARPSQPPRLTPFALRPPVRAASRTSRTTC